MLWRKFLSLTIYINIYHFYQCFMICTNIILSLSVNSIQYVVRWDKGQKTGNKINISTFVWSYLYYKIGSYDAIRTSCSPLIIKFLESHLYCTVVHCTVYSISTYFIFSVQLLMQTAPKRIKCLQVSIIIYKKYFLREHLAG